MVTIVGEEIDLADWKHFFPPPFDPSVEEYEHNGTKLVVLHSSNWTNISEAGEVFADATRIVRRINGMMSLADHNSQPISPEEVYFINENGSINTFLFANAGSFRIRDRGDRARFSLNSGGEISDPSPSWAQILFKDAEDDQVLSDLYDYISRSDNWFDLYKVTETVQKRIGGGKTIDKLLAPLEVNSPWTWDVVRRTANCHRHAPNPIKYPWPNPSPKLEEARAFILQAVSLLLAKPSETS